MQLVHVDQSTDPGTENVELFLLGSREKHILTRSTVSFLFTQSWPTAFVCVINNVMAMTIVNRQHTRRVFGVTCTKCSMNLCDRLCFLKPENTLRFLSASKRRYFALYYRNASVVAHGTKSDKG